jgi:hypothetical protein
MTKDMQDLVEEQLQHNDVELEAAALADEVEPVRELPRRSTREKKKPM